MILQALFLWVSVAVGCLTIKQATTTPRPEGTQQSGRMTNMGTQTEQILEAVEMCEEYANDHFAEWTYFTQVTKWQDGDFRILVSHGMGYLDRPHCRIRHHERITYHHDHGEVVYSHVKKHVDRHENVTLHSEILAEDPLHEN